MAINPILKKALEAISYPDINVTDNYKLERKLINATHIHLLKGLYKTWDHIITVDNYNIPVRLYSPNEKTKGNDIIIFFHGGGWVTGNINSYDMVCANLAKNIGRTVVSVDYRLAPEYKFPVGLEDCYYVTKEIIMDKSLFEAEKITLMGDSAGGNLAAAVSLMARDRGEFSIDSQILLYPSTYNNHTESSPFNSIRENATGYLLTSKRICDYLSLYIRSDRDLNNPYFAPLLADVKNQPKTLVITAEYDPLRDEGEAYGQKLKEAGNYVEMYRIADGLHGFFSLPPTHSVVRDVYDIIDSFLEDIQ